MLKKSGINATKLNLKYCRLTVDYGMLLFFLERWPGKQCSTIRRVWPTLRQHHSRQAVLVGKASLSYSVSDSDSVRSVDPYPDSEPGSGSSRAKLTHKSRKKFIFFMF